VSGDRVDVDRRRTAAQSLKAEVVEREASEIRKPLHCIARDEELALEVNGCACRHAQAHRLCDERSG